MWSEDSSTANAFGAKRELLVIEEALRAAGIDAPVQFEEETTSTNDTALVWAQRGEPEWSTVVAGHQTGGRGRLGRDWTSTPGASLLFSFVLRPDMEPDQALLLTLLAGAAMAAACREVAGVDVRCKWPNDLMTKRGKVGGILAEARVRDADVQHVVVGVGLNLEGAPEGVPEAAALGAVDRPKLLTAFFRAFRERYFPQGQGFAHLVISAYVPLSDTLGKQVRAQTLDGETVEGVAVDLDPLGNLVVKTDGGLETVGFGEVEHLR